MSYVLRASKFRHVFGEVTKPENNYQGVKPAAGTPEGLGLAGNSKFFGLSWASGGGGALAIIPLENTGRLPTSMPMITGHQGTVLDWDFNPFNDYQVASASDDCTTRIWQIPEGGLTENLTDPVISLEGHQKKVHIVQYHKVAENIVTTASHDHTVRIWDLTKSAAVTTVDSFSEVIWSISYDLQGKQFVAASKDKMTRIVDARSASVTAEWKAHQGAKPAKAVWLGRRDMIVTCGFSKQSERQVILWDPRNLEKPVHCIDIDVAAGMLMPMYDEETSVLFVAGKGDTTIRYYEIADEEPHLFFLNAFQAKEPQKGVCRLPKMAGDVMQCEIARVLRLAGSTVEIVPMRVPRKATTFQDDIFPDTPAPVAALSAEEWVSGKNSDPKLMSSRPGEGIDAAPKAALKSPFEMAAEIEEKDKRIEELEAEVKALKAKLGM